MEFFQPFYIVLSLVTQEDYVVSYPSATKINVVQMVMRHELVLFLLHGPKIHFQNFLLYHKPILTACKHTTKSVPG